MHVVSVVQSFIDRGGVLLLGDQHHGSVAIKILQQCTPNRFLGTTIFMEGLPEKGHWGAYVFSHPSQPRQQSERDRILEDTLLLREEARELRKKRFLVKGLETPLTDPIIFADNPIMHPPKPLSVPLQNWNIHSDNYMRARLNGLTNFLTLQRLSLSNSIWGKAITREILIATKPVSIIACVGASHLTSGIDSINPEASWKSLVEYIEKPPGLIVQFFAISPRTSRNPNSYIVEEGSANAHIKITPLQYLPNVNGREDFTGVKFFG